MASPDEAARLLGAGASFLGVEIHPDFLMRDQQAATAHVARVLADCPPSHRVLRLTSRRGVTENPAVSMRAIDVAIMADVGNVEVDEWQYGRGLFGADSAERLQRAGKQTFLVRLDVDDSCDPAWFSLPFGAAANLPNTIMELQLLTRYTSAWQILTVEAPKFPDEPLQLSHIEDFGRSRPVFVGLDLSPSNARVAEQALPSVGFAFDLNQRRPDSVWPRWSLSIETALAVLQGCP